MLTGEIRSQIDSIWNDFWSGGVSNPLSVIEQITYLLFIKRLDELHTVEERKSTQLKIEMERRIFPKGKDERGRDEPCTALPNDITIGIAPRLTRSSLMSPSGR
jgi:type I restriction enzyme M protein